MCLSIDDLLAQFPPSPMLTEAKELKYLLKQHRVVLEKGGGATPGQRLLFAGSRPLQKLRAAARQLSPEAYKIIREYVRDAVRDVREQALIESTGLEM